MDPSLYINKAELFAKRGDFNKAVENMEKVIEINDDIVSVTKAHCFLGEYYFVNNEYELSKKHLEWILDNCEDLERNFDDLLNVEMEKADILLDIIDRFIK